MAQGTLPGAAVPTAVSLEPARTITTGGMGSGACATTLTNVSYCWGNGWQRSVLPATLPMPVPGGQAFSSFAVDYVRSCGITPTASLFCWTWLADTVGYLAPHLAISPPSAVLLGVSVASVSAASNNMCVLATDGRVFCTGSLADPSAPDGGPPLLVAGGTFRPSVLAKGAFHACAIGDRRQVYCWGAGSAGQLGLGSYASTATPTIVVP